MPYEIKYFLLGDKPGIAASGLTSLDEVETYFESTRERFPDAVRVVAFRYLEHNPFFWQKTKVREWIGKGVGKGK